MCTKTETCKPTAGSAAAECQAVAQDALTVMQDANTLITAQQPKYDSVDNYLVAIENVQIEETVNDAIEGINELAPTLVTEVDALSCASFANAYYGIYNQFLHQVSHYGFRAGGMVTAIAFHAIVLMLVTVTVNKRLGAGGAARVRTFVLGRVAVCCVCG